MIVIESYGFPDPRDASDYGLVAVGGSYHPRMLLAAYATGIFPWPSRELPFAWFSPNPRMVLRPEDLHVSRSLRKTIRKQRFRVTWDTRFEEVIRACAAAYRPGQGGTWINEDLIQGFLGLYRRGLAHSVESWDGRRLVGGLYGISLGTVFCGESMFQRRTDASKVAFVELVERLRGWHFRLVDCQVYTDHLAQFGAREWPRDRFLDELRQALRSPTRRGSWGHPGTIELLRPDDRQ
jgi:leucyl/phenylalanyl-tRNA--protein transferase